MGTSSDSSHTMSPRTLFFDVDRNTRLLIRLLVLFKALVGVEPPTARQAAELEELFIL